MQTSSRRVAAMATLTLLAAAVLPSGAATASEADAGGHTAEATTTTSAAAFHDQMRKLWEDHITWTRLYIVSAATGPTDLPDIEATTERLLANQVDIGDAIKPFYGEPAGDALTALLHDHILTAAEIIAVARSGDTEAQDDAITRWYVNGDDIATFLSDANPEHWPLEAMKAHMRSHLDLTLEEAVARLEARYADEVVAYEKVHADILEMADMLSDGIVAQFPDAFTD